jgi:putative GTP pyrophosphokinase
MAARRRRATGEQLAQWKADYAAVQPTYDSLVGRVDHLLRDLLTRAEIDFAQIEGRVKRADSFAEKIRRKENYKDPLAEITDLAALRVVTYTLGDVQRVGDVIAAEFKVDDERSVVKGEVTDPDRFGYVSTHYIVWICPPRSDLAEWGSFGGRAFEIQVRTVLQHAWAAIDHKLNYKSRTEIPRDVQRRLFRVSALLEVADEQFDEVERQSRSVTREYGEQIEQGNLDSLAVDRSSYDVYVRAYKLSDRWKPRIEEAGGVLENDETVLARDRSDVLRIIEERGIRTIGELNALVEDAERWGVPVLTEISSAFKEVKGAAVETNVDDVLTMLVLYGTLAPKAVIDSVLWFPPTPETLHRLVTEARRPGRKRAGSPPRPTKPKRR